VPDVPGDKSSIPQALEEVAGDGGRRGFALRAGDRDDALSWRFLHPKAETSDDWDAKGLEVRDLGATPSHARCLHDDIAAGESFKPASRKGEHLVPEHGLVLRGVLDDDDVGTELGQPS